MSLVFYDFEVFKHNWLVVFIEPIARRQTVIIDDREKLTRFYEQHKQDIWVGYNNTRYDQYIAQSILCGFNPYEVNEWIISKGRQGWEFSQLFRHFPINNFDVGSRSRSLKELEAFMGHDIKESDVPFDIDRPLTPEEIEETVRYCVHDVEQTIEVFTQTYETRFEPQMGLIKAFNLPLSYVSKTHAQLAAHILGARQRTYTDEFETRTLPPTLQLSEKYKHVVDFFVNAKEDTYAEMKERTRYLKEDVPRLIDEEKRMFEASRTKTQRDRCLKRIESYQKELKTLPAADWTNPEAYKKWFYSRNLETEVSGVPHKFAWGGVHGAIPKYAEEGRFVMADVASLYPSIMIRYGYHSRSISDPQRYIQIYETNLAMKKTHDPQRPAYKLVCNTVYGTLRAENNPLYDPLMASNIIIAGQLLILDLIEHLEGVCKLIQSNTDGILVKVDSDKEYEEFCRIVHEWEERTGLKMEINEYDRIYQKDVNGYIVTGEKEETKRIGSYVKELSAIDNDLPIVNRAVTEYLLNGVHPSETINACDDLIEFQKVVRVKGDFKYAVHMKNGTFGDILNGKTFRVFASTRKSDGKIGRCKGVGHTVMKFADTPDKCFIYNGKVLGLKCPEYLDKKYYVDLAIKRITHKKTGFGVTME